MAFSTLAHAPEMINDRQIQASMTWNQYPYFPLTAILYSYDAQTKRVKVIAKETSSFAWGVIQGRVRYTPNRQAHYFWGEFHRDGEVYVTGRQLFWPPDFTELQIGGPFMVIFKYQQGTLEPAEIEIRTDIHCKLVLRTMEGPAQFIPKTIIKRGVATQSCPDALYLWKAEYPQLQERETLQHNFLIPDLVDGQVLWFYMRGVVMSQESPSLSPALSLRIHDTGPGE